LMAEGECIAFSREAPDQQIVFIGWRGDEVSPEIHVPVWQAGLGDGTRLRDLIGGETYTVQKGVLTVSGLHHGTALMLEVQG
jgi:hypothetical protein